VVGDRLTGNVYKCQAPQPGRASCEADIATGSVVIGRSGGATPVRKGLYS
jgi:hypothetical protein